MSDILKTTKGGSYFDPFARTEGKHVDDADKAIYFWKKCTQVSHIITSDWNYLIVDPLVQFQCALETMPEKSIPSYIYSVEHDSCGKLFNTKQLHSLLKLPPKTLFLTKLLLENEDLLKQSLCECDRSLVNTLHSLKPEFKQYDKSNCKIGDGIRLNGTKGFTRS